MLLVCGPHLGNMKPQHNAQAAWMSGLITVSPSISLIHRINCIQNLSLPPFKYLSLVKRRILIEEVSIEEWQDKG